MDNFTNIIKTDTGEQVHFIDSRYYTKDHINWYPGVTAILGVKSKGKQYENWLKSNGFNADYLAKTAMEQGSRVHQAIQNLLIGEEVKFGTMEQVYYSREEWVMISRFIDFYTEFKPETIAVEAVLVSDKLQFGTQLDYVCKLNGELYYLDHKTGSLYDSASMQIAASIKLWNEYYPETPITKGGVLHLDSAHRGRDKTGKKIQGQGWQLVEIDNIEGNWQDFEHLHAIWKRDNPDYKPFNVSYPASYKL
jgi:hypothetical protein